MTDATRPGLTITCQELVELITDYLEGALDGPLTAEIEAHLKLCPHCVVYLEQIRATIRALGHVPCQSLDEDVTAGLMAAFRDFQMPGSPRP